MCEKQLELARLRYNKSMEDLKAAGELFNICLYKQSINRSYYAIFHMTRTLLVYDSFDSSKHSGIIAFFNQNYIGTGKIDKKFLKNFDGQRKIQEPK